MQAYKQIRLLGKGSFGEAILCSKRSDGSQYVIKKVNIAAMPEKEKQDAIAEAKVLQKLNHPYIIAYFDCFTDRGSLCIVLEYADSGDLGQQIEKAAERQRFFKEAQILTWFAQMALFAWPNSDCLENTPLDFGPPCLSLCVIVNAS